MPEKNIPVPKREFAIKIDPFTLMCVIRSCLDSAVVFGNPPEYIARLESFTNTFRNSVAFTEAEKALLWPAEEEPDERGEEEEREEEERESARNLVADEAGICIPANQPTK